MKQTYFPSSDNTCTIQAMPWQASPPTCTIRDLEAMHGKAVEEVTKLEQRISRLEAETAQAHIDRRTADVKARRLGELMDELREVNSRPIVVGPAKPLDEPAARPIRRSSRAPIFAVCAIAVLALAALLASQTREGEALWSHISHAASTRMLSGFVSSR